ncbi:unnamed protein product, partial [Prunus brigantina]
CPQLALAHFGLASKTKILKTLWLCLIRTLQTAGKMLPRGWQKNPEEVKKHYELVVEDIMLIESGQVPIPDYKK